MTSRRAEHRERGSAAVELVILAGVLALLFSTGIWMASLVAARENIQTATQEAGSVVQSLPACSVVGGSGCPASLQQTYAQTIQQVAQAHTPSGSNNAGALACLKLVVASGHGALLVQQSSGPGGHQTMLAPGSFVQLRWTCPINRALIHALPFGGALMPSGQLQVSAQVSLPIEPYRTVNGEPLKP